MQRSATIPQPIAPIWERPRAALAQLAARLADPAERPILLWRAFWSPYWVWSDAPIPALPERSARPPEALGLAGEAVVTGIDRLRRRLWLTHATAAICRGIWLGVVFAALLMLVDVLGGPGFNPIPAAIVGGFFLLAGIVLAALSKPSRQQTARMLDRTFGLQERLGTALDDLGLGVPEPGARAPVVYLQMADAANAIAALRNDRRLRPALPVREIVLIVFFSLVLTTLAFLRGLGGGLPELATAHVPVFTPAIERPADPEPSAAEIEAAAQPPTVQEVLERSDRSARARRDLQALAAALADHAITRPAAEEMAQGDYAAAGDQLRDAAGQASDLSQGSREGLASDLDSAADIMDPQTNGLEEATRDAAAGLRQGDEAARNEMRDLADAVENAGSQVIPQGELASQMRTAQQAQSQSGDSGGQSSSSPLDGDLSGSSSQSGMSGDPGSGVDASSSTGPDQSQQIGQAAQPNDSGGNGSEGETASAGEPGSANNPGAAQQPGAGEGSEAGMVAQPGEDPGGPQGDADAAIAQQGGGAGTGESGEPGQDRPTTTNAQLQVGEGEEAADPNVSLGGATELDPAALEGANEQVALPTGSGDEGVQTASDGGSAIRGSGAGITAGSGYAVQGEVGEAGPDSNRVPPQHRETVERYFSNGSGE